MIDEIYRTIVELEDEHPYAPTVREISARSGFPVSTVWRQIEKLAEQGKLTWVPGTARTIQTVRDNT